MDAFSKLIVKSTDCENHMKLSVEHRATIHYHFTDSVEYGEHYIINDRLEHELTMLCRLSPTAYIDTRFCCQWEGFQVIAECPKELESISEKFMSFFKSYGDVLKVIEE